MTQAICFDAKASRSAGLLVWVHRQCTDPKLLLCFDCVQDAIQLCLCVYAIVSLQDSDAMISLCVAQFCTAGHCERVARKLRRALI